MALYHLVRVGCQARVGRFISVDGLRAPRGTRVVVRTTRGLELGVVTASPEHDEEAGWGDGSLLRIMTLQDVLLEERLERHKAAAQQDCERQLRQRGLPVSLLEVEQLFDGQAIYFYFLGDDHPELAAITKELAETYSTRIGFAHFAETLEQGCGPGCGTEGADSGCGSEGGCSTCSVAHACKK